ncbi:MULTISPECIES: MFS transporter [Limosilactobacillus]|jgi:MFS family permease|uniref:MFS family major facilitator transporter n=1 Tax=Limosilactobacillus panis DSM 6035 TaxID=1423782 RepID=A0A0R1XCN6_9LACO|nr:MFS transporter [Limosilactobacillus panis]KRM27453.1 MFS family major facilitator transporter [Limosilactobacillus panis DSM 6035]
MEKSQTLATKLAFLSASFMVTSAYAIQSALPQIKAALNVTQPQVEYLVTTPSFAVMFFVVLSPLLQDWFHISDKHIIMAGITLVGIAGLVPAFVNNYWVILASRLALGAGYGLYNSQAISLISVWYEGHERTSMQGWRSAFEQIGNACTLTISSLLLIYAGWHAAFLVYGLAFAVMAFFAWRVPNDTHSTASDKDDQQSSQETISPMTNQPVTKISPLIIAILLFVLLIKMDFIGMEDRFPGLAVAINGAKFTGTGTYLSLMLIGATLGGASYGTLQKHFGYLGTIYIGLVLLAIANFLFGFGGSNFAVIAAGILLVGFPMQVLTPLIFNILPFMAPMRLQTKITSFILIGFNFGAFFSPTADAWFNRILGQELSGFGLAAPFRIYGVMMLVIAGLIFFGKHLYQLHIAYGQRGHW